MNGIQCMYTNYIVDSIKSPLLEMFLIKGSVTVGYIFVYCRFISLFAKIQ